MPLPLTHLRCFYSEAYKVVTDFQYYPKVFAQPWRRTLLYLLYLSAHVAVILSLTYAWLYSGELRRFSNWAQQQLPSFEVKNGELQVHAEQPLIRRYQGKHHVTFVFDTTGRYSNADGFDQPALLLTRKNLMLRYQGQTEAHNWTEFGSFAVGDGDLRTWESVIRWTYFPLSYSLLLVYTILAKSLTALFITGFAVLAAARHGARLSFRSSFTIALYGLTPAIVISLAVNLTGLYISYFHAIYLGIAAIYTYMGTQKCVSSVE